MTTHFADGLSIGRDDSYGSQGVAQLGPNVVTYDITPATLDRDGFAAAQQLGAAGDLTLNGALVSSGVGVADVPRAVGLFSAADLSAITFTVYGYDGLGQKTRESLAGPNNSTVATLKAFKKVNRIAASAAVGSNVEAGTVDKFGLPRRVENIGQIAHVGWAGALARDASTVVAAVTTSPATGTTGDPRGTIIPSSAANGSRRLYLLLFVDLTSRVTEFGVQQFGDGVT